MFGRDEHWMRETLAEARNALDHNDVPIGAIAVYQGEIIGRGHNIRELDGDPTGHAEMIALRQAAKHIGHWRLDDVTLYCTLEPCCMCAGAMVLARLPRLVYAAIDPKAGCGGSVMDVLRHPQLNHAVTVDVGLMADEASKLLRDFFEDLRNDPTN